MTKKFGCFVFVMSIAVMLVSNVWAAKITVTSGGVESVVFDSGGFESETVGSDPAGSMTTGLYTLEQDSNSNVEVYGSSSSGPGGNEGEKYLSLYNPGDRTGSNHQEMGAYLGFTQAAATGDAISVEFAIQVDSALTSYSSADPSSDWSTSAFWGLATGPTAAGGSFSGNSDVWIGFVPCGSNYYNDGETPLGMPAPLVLDVDDNGEDDGDLFLICYDTAYRQVCDTNGDPIFVNYDQWYDVSMDYTVGDGAFTISVGDTTSASYGSKAGNAITGLQFLANLDDGTGECGFYLDSVAEVPEPGTIALLITGLFGLLVWKRR